MTRCRPWSKPSEYWTHYEDIYGSYNYGGINVVDYQIPELSYGCFSTTQTGVMEKVRLPGLQQYVNVSTSAGGYGVGAGSYGTPVISSGTTITPVYREPAYTSAEDMERKDGSIGTLKIPSLDINMKVWEGETNASMAKGLGHYTTTSAWDGNVAVCGHNRGAKYVIGDIKDLEIGDTITYRINQSQEQVHSTKRQIENVLSRLNGMQRSVEQEQNQLESKLDTLVRDAKI